MKRIYEFKGEEISNIEKMMKYCSKLGKLFGHPYFFNWSPATNHVDESPEGAIHDVCYVKFRVGKHPEHPVVSRMYPVEQDTVFCLVDRVLEGLGLEVLLDGIKLKSMEDVKNNLEAIKSAIDAYLYKQEIIEINKAIVQHNEFFQDDVPLRVAKK